MTLPQQISTRERFHALCAQIDFLCQPSSVRKSGPADGEAQEVAASLQREADDLSEQLFWDMAAQR